MSITPRSRKAKGRRLQQEVCNLLLEQFSHLEQDDIKPAIMGESGEDVKLSPAARRSIPYSFECKSQERLNIWQALNQADGNSKGHEPVLVFKRNRSKVYAVVEFDHLLKLLQLNNNESLDT